MAGKETMNATGGRNQTASQAENTGASGDPGASQSKGSTTGNSTSATRQSPTPSAADRKQTAQADRQHANAAKQKNANGDQAGANREADEIQDDELRNNTKNEMFGGTGHDFPNSTMFTDGSGGLSDPLALFFMMVFYLDKISPTFSWKDVLDTAKRVSKDELAFSPISVVEPFPPSQQFNDSGTAVVGSGVAGEFDSKRGAVGGQLKDQKTQVSAARDGADKSIVSAKGTSGSGGAGDSGIVVVWPVQTMPTIAGGLNKTVEWPSQSVATFAEPTLSINNGASPIEIDVEFIYAVGAYGIGDSELTAMTGGIDPSGQPDDTSHPPLPGRQKGFWTVEEVMGAIYLATSLVYPFESSPVVATDPKAAPPADTRKSAQYPVIFLKHYSLFPFLTPFVVKGVKIEPDEDQPLIITEADKLTRGVGTTSHLSIPAVRQVVKITLSMISAHYYLPVFGGKDENGQIQLQTSGKTYLGLAKQLMANRLP